MREQSRFCYLIRFNVVRQGLTIIRRVLFIKFSIDQFNCKYIFTFFFFRCDLITLERIENVVESLTGRMVRNVFLDNSCSLITDVH